MLEFISQDNYRVGLDLRIKAKIQSSVRQRSYFMEEQVLVLEVETKLKYSGVDQNG